MNEKLPCIKCSALILPSTAERTGGLCMPCKSGNRENIERAKEYYKKERELDKTCPFRALWRALVDKVFEKGGGFATLTDDEKLYYSVNTLVAEVYNGGFVQFFDNSSGEHYRYAELGLVRLGATSSLDLLRQAKEELFGSARVSQDHAERWDSMIKNADEPALDTLDGEFYKDPDGLDTKLENFAIEVGLVG